MRGKTHPVILVKAHPVIKDCIKYLGTRSPSLDCTRESFLGTVCPSHHQNYSTNTRQPLPGLTYRDKVAAVWYQCRVIYQL